MTRRYTIIAAAILIIPHLFNSHSLSVEKKRVAVLDFSANNVPISYARVVRNFLETSLFSSNHFYMLEREQIEMVFKEHRILRGDIGKTSHTVKIGKTLAVHYAVVGSLDKVDKYSLTVRVVSINQGKIVYAYSEYFDDLKMMRSAAYSLSKRIVVALTEKRIETKEVLKTKKKRPRVESRLEINADLAYLCPYGRLKNVLDTGYGLTLNLCYNGFIFKNLRIFMKTGVYQFSSTGGVGGYLIIPGMIGIGLNMSLAGGFYLVPWISGGSTMIFKRDENESNLQKMEDPKYDGISEAGLVLGYNIYGFTLFLNGSWGVFWERNGLKEYLALASGIGIRF